VGRLEGIEGFADRAGGQRYSDMASGGRHVQGGLGWLPLFALSFLGAFVFFVATGVLPLRIDDPTDAAPPKNPAAGAADSRDPSSTGQGSTGSDEPGGCKELWAHELRVALAAEATLQEWRLHIDAMDQLVAGEITLAQATALWDASEHGALHRIARFLRLDAALRETPNTCDFRDTTTGVAAQCAEAARAVERTIAAARTAVRTWKLHIREMDELRAGQITAEQAKERWHQLWKTGQVQTVRYDHRATNALSHGCS
jgi:hypothetical protein